MPENWNPGREPIRQPSSWTCSATALAWAANSIKDGRPVKQVPEIVAELNSYGDVINPQVGLTYGDGRYLKQWLDDRGYHWAPLDGWAAARHWANTEQGPVLIGGQRWYHWAVVTGTIGDSILKLMNPAGEWMGVHDRISSSLWNDLGPWTAIGIDAKRSALTAPPSGGSTSSSPDNPADVVDTTSPPGTTPEEMATIIGYLTHDLEKALGGQVDRLKGLVSHRWSSQEALLTTLISIGAELESIQRALREHRLP